MLALKLVAETFCGVMRWTYEDMSTYIGFSWPILMILFFLLKLREVISLPFSKFANVIDRCRLISFVQRGASLLGKKMETNFNAIFKRVSSCSNGMIDSGGLVSDDQGRWLDDFSSNDKQGGVHCAKLFAIFHGLSLLIHIEKTLAICESYSKDSVVILQDRDHHQIHAYASLLMKITGLMDRIAFRI